MTDLFKFPVNAFLDADGLHVTFTEIGVDEFVDAFSHETIARQPQARVTLVSYQWGMIEGFRNPQSGHVPIGIIMHTARVGSTLEARLLRCMHGIAVYSEPSVINDLLMPPWKQRPTEIITALRFVVHLLGNHAGCDFILKLRSWNSLFAAAIVQAFPSTPWIFSVRDPVEIGVSVQRRPPTWMRLRSRPDNPFTNYAQAHGDVDTPERYFACMLAAFFDSIGSLQRTNGILIDYPELPAAVWETVCPHFRLRPTGEELNQMRAASRFDAKSTINEQRLFVPDVDQKRSSASPALCQAVDEVAKPALHRIKELFKNQAIPKISE